MYDIFIGDCYKYNRYVMYKLADFLIKYTN